MPALRTIANMAKGPKTRVLRTTKTGHGMANKTRIPLPTRYQRMPKKIPENLSGNTEIRQNSGIDRILAFHGSLPESPPEPARRRPQRLHQVVISRPANKQTDIK